MFSRAIYGQGFVNPKYTYLDIMKKIKYTNYSYEGDESLLNTSRALLLNRIPDGECLNIYTFTLCCNIDLHEDKYKNATEGLIENALYFYNITGIYGTNSFEAIKDSFRQAEGWKEEKKTAVFFQDISVCCFQNLEKKISIIMGENIQTKEFHHLQMGIPVFLPWYFEENPLDDDEKDLIISLSEKSAKHYNSAIEKLLNKLQLKEIFLREKLHNFSTAYITEKIDTLQDSIEECYRQISYKERDIRDYYERISETNLLLAGCLKAKAESTEDDSLVSFFANSDNIILEKVIGGDMTVGFKGTLTYWDEEYAKEIINNDRSILYTYACYGDFKSLKKFYEKLFIEKTIKIKFCAAYVLYGVGRCSGISGYNFSPDYKDCMPNPHICHYSCLGDNASVINDYLKNQEYESAIMQAQASALSLNLGDTAVMRHFVPDITSLNSGKYFITENGDERFSDIIKRIEVEINETNKDG